MSSPLAALHRLIAARSHEEVEKILAEEPVLLSHEADQALAERQDIARKNGDKDMVAALAELRELLRSVERLSDFKLPDMPGSHAAADLINALVDAAPNTAIPPAALTDVFYVVLDALRAHAKENNLAPLLRALQSVDRRAKAARAKAAKAAGSRQPELLAIIEQWMDAPSWAESQAILEAHNELQSADASAILSLMLEASQKGGRSEDAEFYQEHSDVLARARAQGVEAAYADLIRRQDEEEMRLRFEDPDLALQVDPEESGPPSHLTIGQSQEETHHILERVAAELDAPSVRKDYHASRATALRFMHATLAPADVLFAQDLCRRVIESGGSGNTHAQEGLLNLIAAAEEPSSGPFWVEMLGVSRARDGFTAKRRVLATAALARLAIRKGSDAALQVLRDMCRHKNADVRANAVHHLGQVYLFSEKPLPAADRVELARIATSDAAFPVRFTARVVLMHRKLPVPLDNPGGVYTLKVTYLRGKGTTYRTIEMTTDQTLEDLHYAIQRSINWDADHLYSFYMKEGEEPRFEIASPDGDDGVSFASEWSIGELGLAAKQKFIYLFDFGDEHAFQVDVLNTRPQAEKVEYPRVVEKRGRAPKQYAVWE